MVKANPLAGQCLLAGAEVCPAWSCPEASAAGWPLRDFLLSREPDDGNKAALEKVRASNDKSKRNKDFC